MKRVAVLGSTGSIGTQALDIIRCNGDKLKVYSLVAYSNAEKLALQVEEFHPQYSALISHCGEECLVQAVKGADIALVATRGIVAIESILYCLSHGIDVALANKEALVCAGELICGSNQGAILPVDSEHCAIRRCLQSAEGKAVDKILLTASGGPFWNLSGDQLKDVTAEQALRHPNWNMGAKITVDSATMMNKSFEVAEAHFLFGVPTENIDIVVHRQSIVHSLVQFCDGEIVAQMASPDMRLPIQTALLGAEGQYRCKSVDFAHLLDLTFEQCDFERFPCAKLGYEVMKLPPLCRTVMNAANDVCVDRFLQGKFCFANFYNIINNAIEHFCEQASKWQLSVQNIGQMDSMARIYTEKMLDEVQC